jgi:hypothetical protein
MYDTIHVPCPKCQTTLEFQSKSGDCTLMEYTLENAPVEVLEDVNRHAPRECKKCGSFIEIQGLDEKPMAVQVNRPVAEEQGKIPYRKRRNHKGFDP